MLDCKVERAERTGANAGCELPLAVIASVFWSIARTVNDGRLYEGRLSPDVGDSVIKGCE